MIALNGITPTLKQGQTIGENSSNFGYALSEWEKDDEGHIFHFQFNTTTDTGDLSIAIANVFNFKLYCNEELIYQRQGDPTARLAIANLPNDEALIDLTIVFETSENTIRAQVGSSSYIALANEGGRLLSAFCFGILFIILAYCVMLWMQKPSEIVLTYMIALILIMVLRDITQPFPLLPQEYPTLIKPGLNIALAACMVQLAAEYAFPDVFKRNPRIRLVLLFAPFSIAICYLAPIGLFSILYHSFNIAYHIICIAMIVCSCARKKRCCHSMATGLSFAICSLTFYTIADWGYISPGLLVVQGYVIQFYCIPFLLACMASINGRFVGYYRELTALNAKLDKIVEQRIEQLNRQEERKHQLMTNIFHDLRTPLFISKNCVERLRKDSEMLASSKQTLEILDNRLGFIGTLTEDLFTLAKLEEGRLMLTEDYVNVSDLCRRQISSMELQSSDKFIKLECKIADNCLVWGDEHRIEQALQNVLANAVSHTSKGGVVSLALKRTPTSIIIRITNEGLPISPSDTEHIFDRYYRADSGGLESSGLGLTIASEIMKAHRGSISFEAEHGNPSFVFLFPAIPK